MKVRVISLADCEVYCKDHGVEWIFDVLTEEQFMAIYEYTSGDWEFLSLDAFADEFNADGAWAPTPTDHIIRFFPNE